MKLKKTPIFHHSILPSSHSPLIPLSHDFINYTSASMFKRRQILKEESEDALISGCIQWDRNAQNKLYKRFCAKMFAVCYRFSKSREEAEDTFHEGFMKVFENIASFKNEGSLEGWIRRIMVNTAIEKYRKNLRLIHAVSMDEHQSGLDDYYTDDIVSRIEAKELMQLIQELPPAYKMVFNLYVFEGLKHREIAEQLSISEGTSKSNLSDARSLLKKKLNSNLNSCEKTVSLNG